MAVNIIFCLFVCLKPLMMSENTEIYSAPDVTNVKKKKTKIQPPIAFRYHAVAVYAATPLIP